MLVNVYHFIMEQYTLQVRRKLKLTPSFVIIVQVEKLHNVLAPMRQSSTNGEEDIATVRHILGIRRLQHQFIANYAKRFWPTYL